MFIYNVNDELKFLFIFKKNFSLLTTILFIYQKIILIDITICFEKLNVKLPRAIDKKEQTSLERTTQDCDTKSMNSLPK